MRPHLFTIFCGLLMSLSAFSTDIMLPAFADMSSDLAAPMGRVQLSIPVFALFMAFGHFVFGIASDEYGRKPMLLTGLVIFLMGTLLVMFAPSINTLLMGRALQGFGSSVGSVLGRAMLRDRSSG